MSAAPAITLALLLAAGPFADLDQIDRDVTAFTGAPIGAEGGAAMPVDRRLRLNPCGSPLALGWRTARHDSVVVECPERGGWRLFVAVRQGDAATTGPAAVSRGDGVTIAVSGDGFSVSQPGEAVDGGAVGAWIRVRAAHAKAQPQPQTLRARIVRPGLVEVPLP